MTGRSRADWSKLTRQESGGAVWGGHSCPPLLTCTFGFLHEREEDQTQRWRTRVSAPHELVRIDQPATRSRVQDDAMKAKTEPALSVRCPICRAEPGGNCVPV